MKSLNRKLLKFQKEVNERINFVKKRYAQLIVWELIYATPVDTSKALSNWIVNLRKAKGKEIEALYVGVGGSTFSASASMAYSLGNAIIQRAKVGEIIYITNSVDYLELLNKGYSTQAPVGFIEKAVQRATEQAKRIKL